MGAACVLMGQDDSIKDKSEFALADKSDDIFYISGTTSSNRACAWRLGECMGLFYFGKHQCNCMAAPHSSPIAASITTKI